MSVTLNVSLNKKVLCEVLEHLYSNCLCVKELRSEHFEEIFGSKQHSGPKISFEFRTHIVCHRSVRFINTPLIDDTPLFSFLLEHIKGVMPWVN